MTVDELESSPDRGIESISGPGAELAKQRFELAPAELDRVQVGRVRRQVQEGGARCLDELPNAIGAVRADVVEDDDVPGMQLPREEVLDEGREDVLVGCALDRHHRAHAAEAEGADHRGHRPGVPRNRAMRALASWRSRVLACHRDVAAGFVDEHEPSRVQVLRELEEPPPEFLDSRRLLLGSGQGLFFRVSPSFRSVLPMVARLTLVPVRRWYSHAAS